MTPSQKEGCENATYWREQFPNQNVFVSYYKSLCTFDLDRDVTLKSNPNATVTLHSSCDQKDIDSTLSGRMAVPNLPQDDGNSKTNLIIFVEHRYLSKSAITQDNESIRVSAKIWMTD